MLKLNLYSLHFGAIVSFISLQLCQGYYFDAKECSQSADCYGNNGVIKHKTKPSWRNGDFIWKTIKDEFDPGLKYDVVIHITNIEPQKDFKMTIFGKREFGEDSTISISSSKDYFIFLQNILYFQVLYNGLETHSGFTLYYFADCKLIQGYELLNHRAEKEKTPVSFTGLRLGGTNFFRVDPVPVNTCWFVQPQVDSTSIGDQVYLMFKNITIEKNYAVNVIDALSQKPVFMLSNDTDKEYIKDRKDENEKKALKVVKTHKTADVIVSNGNDISLSKYSNSMTSSMFLIYPTESEKTAFTLKTKVFDKKDLQCIKNEEMCRFTPGKKNQTQCSQFERQHFFDAGINIFSLAKSHCKAMQEVLDYMENKVTPRTVVLPRSGCANDLETFCSGTIHVCSQLTNADCSPYCMMYHLYDYCEDYESSKSG